MDTPQISKPLLWFFRQVVRRYFRRHFRAVRVSNAAAFERCDAGPVLVYANHSSWWDPMVSVLLASRYQPVRNHFAPMDAEALKRYGILKRLGMFGVEMHTLRGAAQFLRTSLSVLKSDAVLWITPQGRFADPRERPLEFKPGLAALASRVKGGCTVMPLAIEYTFWDERLPEVLLHFGEPVRVQDRLDRPNEFSKTSKELETRLRVGLEEAMKTLAVQAMGRDAGMFELLLSGRVGTGGWYQRAQRALALLRGRQYQSEHTKSGEAGSREEHR